MRAPWIALAVALACAACNSTSLKPGFCRGPADCPGSTCNMMTWKCMTDGGIDSDARDARDAPVEMPFNCNNGKDMCAADAGTNVCNPDGGMCVECLTDDHCVAKNSKAPICRSQLCGPCQTDNDCPDPKICLPDGHCATTGEVIYVEQVATGCSAADGTTAMPYCTLTDGIAHLDTAHDVLVARGPLNGPLTLNDPSAKVFVIGKQGSVGPAKVGAGVGTTAVTVSGGDVLIRDLEVFNGGSATSKGIVANGSMTKLTLSNVTVNLTTDGLGIQADSGAMLTMDHCTVINNPKGGILLDAALFDIKNTKVTNNGPGDDGTPWGGLRAKNLSTGAKRLQSVTVQNNKQVGVSCTAAVIADGVLVSDNAGGIQIISSCMFDSCVAGTTNCGAPF